MTDTDFDFLPLRVIKTCADGKHRYDPEGKRKLIEACRRPGASLAGLALKACVNANQLHKWVRLEERRERAADATADVGQPSSAFAAVVTVDEASSILAPRVAVPCEQPSTSRRELFQPSRPASTARLSATLPNGVVVELECSGRDASLVSAMIAALGAP
ncbi:IS66-like element accessory protein TnpA [Paraburkholderia silvatlantica]|uniref:IS66-like element accessory protein TnpA n=1 Tax=Paraburkholderia silvatlantica TaxID=321895 RepID=UPI00105D1CD7|nr:transposase [Paraburkholderia silvatlantica]TDQ77492.1 transposase [Paraburkholderia silvatlantica]